MINCQYYLSMCIPVYSIIGVLIRLCICMSVNGNILTQFLMACCRRLPIGNAVVYIVLTLYRLHLYCNHVRITLVER